MRRASTFPYFSHFLWIDSLVKTQKDPLIPDQKAPSRIREGAAAIPHTRARATTRRPRARPGRRRRFYTRGFRARGMFHHAPTGAFARAGPPPRQPSVGGTRTLDGRGANVDAGRRRDGDQDGFRVRRPVARYTGNRGASRWESSETRDGGLDGVVTRGGTVR